MSTPGHPLQTAPAGSVVILAPELLPPASYFALMARYGRVVVDWHARYDKRRKETHRFAIADAAGTRMLTIPVSRPEGAFIEGNLCWNRITVSAHGRWWETLPNALESAYGRTPFFQYYAHRFAPFWREPQPGLLLADFANSLLEECCAILGLDTRILDRVPDDAGIVDDFRGAEGPAISPYWQLHPVSGSAVSVLDLIFNQGPEAPLWLRCD